MGFDARMVSKAYTTAKGDYRIGYWSEDRPQPGSMIDGRISQGSCAGRKVAWSRTA